MPNILNIPKNHSLDYTEAEDIKKSWQEYTEELYKKDLHDPDNHDGVITYLEPDIVECEVMWALRSEMEQNCMVLSPCPSNILSLPFAHGKV